ncbi:MAG TPA: YbgC/FadM family acyl-CoA thioesterase [Polyangiaceae bacterium]|jgi:4-hydroxybenzoyl-CoA thioesterase|nr:YbgC/FadM family acyl-CoA thioesterase [Polyangiaceae bacterium]
MSTSAVDPNPPLVFRVYLEDTDAGGIVYHASYLRWMERARTEALRRAGAEQSRTFEQDLSFVLHSINLRFHAPALLDAQVSVTCELLEQRKAGFEFTQRVRSFPDGALLCSAEVVVVCISLASKRPKRIPPEVAESLTRVTRRPPQDAPAVDVPDPGR